MDIETTEAARLMVQLDAEERALSAELQQVRQKLEDTRAFLMAQLGDGEAVPMDDGTVVVKGPGDVPKARLNTLAVEQHREVLESIGLTKQEPKWTNPTVTQLRQSVPMLTAMGLRLEDLVYTPPPATTVQIVTIPKL